MANRFRCNDANVGIGEGDDNNGNEFQFRILNPGIISLCRFASGFARTLSSTVDSFPVSRLYFKSIPLSCSIFDI